jgi:hypothetical protein
MSLIKVLYAIAWGMIGYISYFLGHEGQAHFDETDGWQT